MATDFDALDRLSPLPPEDLPRQWVLAPTPPDVPEVWQRRDLAGWHLGAHPDAHVCALLAADGTNLGWVLEPMAYLDGDGGTVPGADLVLPVPGDASPAAVERALYGRDERGRSDGRGLEGMWVAIVVGGRSDAPVRRVYLGAIHSVVYAPDQRAVATTHNLVPGVRRDRALSAAFDPLAAKSFFTFGLTAFVGVHRLLPNHYLDLDTFDAVRHWPLAPPDPLPTGREGAAAVVGHAQRIVDRLATRSPGFRVFLSAGNDSRAVLSLLRPFVERGGDVVLSTTAGRNLWSRVDLQAARRLARIAGLPHEITTRRRHRSEAEDVMRAFIRVGESKGGPILSAPGLTDPEARAADERFTLAGMGGETARAVYWKRGLGPDGSPSPRLLAERTRSPMTEPVLAAVTAWLEGLPAGMDPTTVLDLAYVEQRMGCWESPSRYLFPGRPRVASPMTAAFNIQTMLRLPEEYRAAGRLQRDMVEHAWPELLDVPINQPEGALRLRRDAGVQLARVRRRLPLGGRR